MYGTSLIGLQWREAQRRIDAELPDALATARQSDYLEDQVRVDDLLDRRGRLAASLAGVKGSTPYWPDDHA